MKFLRSAAGLTKKKKRPNKGHKNKVKAIPVEGHRVVRRPGSHIF
jgi:hypothetical protein